jgi:hypothetical protein
MLAVYVPGAMVSHALVELNVIVLAAEVPLIPAVPLVGVAVNQTGRVVVSTVKNGEGLEELETTIVPVPGFPEPFT